MVTHADDVAICIAVEADVLRGAAALICDRGDLERRAFERGVLHGFGLGWHQAMAAATERVTAA
jgi:hypothetical protein